MFTRVAMPLVGLVLLSTAACSSSAPPSSRPPASSQHGATRSVGTHAGPPASTASSSICAAGITAVICVTVRLTGQVSVAGAATVVAPVAPGDDPSTTCGALAKGSEGELPLGDHASISGEDLAWDLSPDKYHGPATYVADGLHLSIGDNVFIAAASSKTSITVAPDFATTMSFTNLASNGDTPGALSGSISWTCVDPS